MANVDRYHGKAYAASFYGYQPRAVQICNSTDKPFSYDSSTNPIVEDNYEKAIKAFGQIGTVVLLGLAGGDYAYFSAVFDGATVNDGPGADTDGQWGALKDALASQLGYDAANFGISGDATTLNQMGRWVGDNNFNT
jgi:hypothetical protein